MLIASVLNIQLREDLFSENFVLLELENGFIEKNYEIITSMNDITFLSESKIEKNLIKKLQSKEIKELKSRGFVIGHNFDCINNNQDYTFPLSKTGYGRVNLDVLIPLYCTPLFISKKNSLSFLKFSNSTLHCKNNTIEEHRKLYLNRRTLYWNRITNESNPESSTIRKKLLQIENFGNLLF